MRPEPTNHNRDAKTIRLAAPPQIRDASDVRFFTYPSDAAGLLVDLSGVEWISPVGVVALLALCRNAEQVDGIGDVTILVPQNTVAKEYLSAIGFHAALRDMGGTLEGDVGSATSASIAACLPVTLVTRESEMEAAANQLEHTLLNLQAPVHVIHATYLLMTELTNNAWEHGSPCYVVAQTHSGVTSGTPGMHLAIADFGPGFRASLAGLDPPPTNESEAIALAFQEGVTSTGDPQRGLGLSYVAESVDNYPGARFEIVSRDGLVQRRNHDSKLFQGPDCRGVFVAAYFPFSPDGLSFPAS